jgi:hypothetical protein
VRIAGGLCIETREGVDHRLDDRDPVEERGAHLGCGKRPSCDPARQLARPQSDDLVGRGGHTDLFD